MKKISAKILITQLVILFRTLFIFPIKVKADDVSYPFFLYNVRHTYEEDNSYVHPFRHKYEFYIHANHEMTGRFIISVTTPGGSTAHTWFCESGGEIYNNQIMDRSVGTTVFVTGQQYLKVTLMYLTDSAIDIMNVRSILFSQTDLDGNPITTDQSLWSEVQKIEDHTFQLLSAVGFVNDNLTDVRSKLQSVITLMNTTNQSLSTLVTTATNILTKVTSIDTAVQQIDNTIDTISWIRGMESGLYYYDNGNYVLDNTSAFKNRTFYFNGITFRDTDQNKIFKFNIGVGYTANQNVKIYINNVDVSNRFEYYVDWNRTYVTIYVHPLDATDPNITYGRHVGFNFGGNVYQYANDNTDNAIDYIDSNDIEYWQLLGFMKQYMFYNQQRKDNQTIIQKLTELISGNNTTNNSVSNNDSSNQQFQQQTQQYDQIESTFQSSFTTDQQAVQQTFNNNTLTIFADTTLWFTQQLTALYNASGQMKILFTMPLLLGLALFFIGRGAKTAAPNTIDSYYSSEQTANVDGVKYYRVRRTSGAHKVFHGFNRK